MEITIGYVTLAKGLRILKQGCSTPGLWARSSPEWLPMGLGRAPWVVAPHTRLGTQSPIPGHKARQGQCKRKQKWCRPDPGMQGQIQPAYQPHTPHWPTGPKCWTPVILSTDISVTKKTTIMQVKQGKRKTCRLKITLALPSLGPASHPFSSVPDGKEKLNKKKYGRCCYSNITFGF